MQLRLPKLRLVDAPRLYTRHGVIPGKHLLTLGCDRLVDRARDAPAEEMAGFFADLHAIRVETIRAAGVVPVETRQPVDEIARRIAPILPERWRSVADRTLAAWEEAGPGLLGDVFGHFDAHG